MRLPQEVSATGAKGLGLASKDQRLAMVLTTQGEAGRQWYLVQLGE